MATHRQLAANRANAAKSTGPRTPEGKAASSRNARSHGIFAPTSTLIGRDRRRFRKLRRALLDRYLPQDPIEQGLVNQIIQARWRISICNCLEAGFWVSAASLETNPGDDLAVSRDFAGHLSADAKSANVFSKYMRYEATARRNEDRALKTLLQHRTTQNYETKPIENPAEPFEISDFPGDVGSANEPNSAPIPSAFRPEISADSPARTPAAHSPAAVCRSTHELRAPGSSSS